MPTTIRLDPKVEGRLAALADSTGRSKAFYLRQLIEEGLSDLEDYYLAADVLERVRRGEEKTFTAAEVRRTINRRHGLAPRHPGVRFAGVQR